MRRLLDLIRGPMVRRLRAENADLRLSLRQVAVNLAHQRRLTASANEAAERAYRERDAANAQAISWLRIAGDQSEALIRQGAARERQFPQPSHPVVVPFGRRRPPA